MALEFKPTEHSYYCSESNYYVDGYENFGRCEYCSWEEFKDDWLDNGLLLDDDLNHLFRFDICNEEDDEGEPTGKLQLWLFFILQRKGIYRPVWIKEIQKSDMPEIEKFLEKRWEYMKKQWQEVEE